MKITIEFESGEKREWFPTPPIIEHLKNGGIISLKTMHPDFGEFLELHRDADIRLEKYFVIRGVRADGSFYVRFSGGWPMEVREIKKSLKHEILEVLNDAYLPEIPGGTDRETIADRIAKRIVEK